MYWLCDEGKPYPFRLLPRFKEIQRQASVALDRYVPFGRSSLMMRFKIKLSASERSWPAHMLIIVSSRVCTARAVYAGYLQGSARVRIRWALLLHAP